MKTAYVFPGQGAQKPGMGKDLYDGNPRARELFEKANQILGFRITDLMFEGSDEDLRLTKVTQPAVFLCSVIPALCTEGLTAPDMVAGHSLGEFSALVVSGALGFEDGLHLVSVRAGAMQKCCEQVPGRMAAIINLPTPEIERICSGTPGVVVAANYNSEGQVVISGEESAVMAACEAMKAAGARRALPLAVGGAFHSPLMEPARAELALAIEEAHLTSPRCPIYQNVSAKAETDPLVIKSNLLCQLTSPVRWMQSTETMVSDGAGHFTEIGPGTVLQGLIRRIALSLGKEVVVDGLE